MSWRGQPLDRDPVAVRPLADRLAGPEEIDHPAPVQRGDGSVDELAAEVLRSSVVEEDHGHVVVHRQPAVLEGHEVVRVRSPGPRLDRGRVATGARRELVRCQPGAPGLPDVGEQAELDPEVDEPRPMEPAEAGDQVVEAIVEGHGRRIVACPHRREPCGPGTVAARVEVDATDRRGSRVLGCDGYRQPAHRRPGRDLDGTFEAVVLAHQDRLYSIALRMLGDPRDAEEAAQDAFVRAYRALAGYDPARIRELRLRPWLATIVLNLCRSRLGRRPAAGRGPLSLDVPLPGDAEPRTADAHGPGGRRRGARHGRCLGRAFC